MSGGASAFEPASPSSSAAAEKEKTPRDGGGILALRIHALRKPIIAAINGASVGMGATMTLPMDVRLASVKARFGFVFVRRGIIPEGCSSWFLPRVVGIGTASEWMLTGRIVEAQERSTRASCARCTNRSDLLPAAYALSPVRSARTPRRCRPR